MRLSQKQIDSRYNSALSQVFGASLAKRIDDVEHEASIRNLLTSCGLYPTSKRWDLKTGLTVAYQYLRQNYRCEYVYKNEIANQLLLKFHGDNSATLLKEVGSDQSIADIVIVNGNTVAYEIKTELDNFGRLEGQLQSYRSLFDCLYIVTHSEALTTITSRLAPEIGIIVLGKDGQLETLRRADSTAHLFNPAKAVLTMRQSELVAAYKKWEGELPQMGSARVFEFCYKWYLSLEADAAHDIFANALKSRRPAPHQFELIRDCDPSLKMVFLGRELSKRYCTTARERLGISS